MEGIEQKYKVQDFSKRYLPISNLQFAWDMPAKAKPPQASVLMRAYVRFYNLKLWA